MLTRFLSCLVKRTLTDLCGRRGVLKLPVFQRTKLENLEKKFIHNITQLLLFFSLGFFRDLTKNNAVPKPTFT